MDEEEPSRPLLVFSFFFFLFSFFVFSFFFLLSSFFFLLLGGRWFDADHRLAANSSVDNALTAILGAILERREATHSSASTSSPLACSSLSSLARHHRLPLRRSPVATPHELALRRSQGPAERMTMTEGTSEPLLRARLPVATSGPFRP